MDNVDISYLSNEVFRMKPEYKLIIKYLANKKTAKKGAGLTEISKFTSKAESNISRRIVTKRLRGSRRIAGLKPREFVDERETGKHRGDHTESTFHLRFKGMLAAIGQGFSLDRSHMYTNYIKFLRDFLNEKELVKWIDGYFKNEVHVFLLLHKYYEIQLTNLNNTTYYYRIFFRNPNFNNMINGINNPTEDIKEIINSYLTNQEILKTLGKSSVNPVAIAKYEKPWFEEYENVLYPISKHIKKNKKLILNQLIPQSEHSSELNTIIHNTILGILILEWQTTIEIYDKEKENFTLEKMITEYSERYKQSDSFRFKKGKVAQQIKKLRKTIDFDSKI